MVTAAAGKLPEMLVGQLAVGDRMVVPVEQPGFQILKLIARDAEGDIHIQGAERVSFVGLKGRYGWD